jgi:hypothetical protein
MPYIIGVLVALAVSIGARALGFDRDRGLYPFSLMVIASYYVLFAVMGGSLAALIPETLIMFGFLVIAVGGFKGNLWWVVAGLFAHGVQDFFHASVVTNTGVPVWWPAWCLAYDVTAAAFLAWLLARSPSRLPALAVGGTR